MPANGPPEKRIGGPAPTPTPTDHTPNGPSEPQTADSITPRHASAFCRWRHFDKNRRRREHAEFKRLLATSQCINQLPSTFGLSQDELRKHANDLVLEHGWSTFEVEAVLDIRAKR
jgi:hypothetical protein